MAGTELMFWDRLKYLFSDPNKFFEEVKTEPSIKYSLLMYLIVGAFTSTASFIFTTFVLRSFAETSSYLMSPFVSIGSFVFGLVTTFVYAGIIHILAKILKGEGTYTNSYNVYAYSLIPSLILGLIPLIGFFGFVYSVILMVIGMSKVHNISIGRAAVACLLPMAVVFIILAIILFIGIMAFTRIF